MWLYFAEEIITANKSEKISDVMGMKPAVLRAYHGDYDIRTPNITSNMPLACLDMGTDLSLVEGQVLVVTGT